MKKLIAGIAATAAIFASALPVLAAGPYNAIPATNPAFEQSGLNSIMNTNNNALRFGAGGRIAIPGAGGQYANSNSAVAPWSGMGSQSIVNPNGAF